MTDFGGQEVRPHRCDRRLAAPVRRPRAVRRQTVQLRLRYATDAGLRGRAAGSPTTSSLTSGGTTVWTRRRRGQQRLDRRPCGTFTDTTGAGWVARLGHVADHAQYYLVEWRNFDGFDKGLQYAYDTTYRSSRRRRVEGREDQVQRARCPRLVPRHELRQRQPRRSTTSRSCRATGAKGGLLHRRLPLRPAASHRARRPTLDPSHAEEPAVATAVVERGLQPGRRPTRSRSAQAKAAFTASTAPPSRRSRRSSRSPTTRAGTPASRSATTAGCSTATPTPRPSSRRRATRRTASASSTANGTPLPTCSVRTSARSACSARATLPTTVSATAPR